MLDEFKRAKVIKKCKKLKKISPERGSILKNKLLPGLARPGRGPLPAPPAFLLLPM